MTLPTSCTHTGDVGDCKPEVLPSDPEGVARGKRSWTTVLTTGQQSCSLTSSHQGSCVRDENTHTAHAQCALLGFCDHNSVHTD